MEHIIKVFFDPLATTKDDVRAILEELPVGSAHPFSPERLLLHRTATGIGEIDISEYPETHFFNAVDLGAIGQTLQTRMTKFDAQLKIFNDEYTVQQAPMGSAFKVPIETGKIAILAVSERYPTYYDLCVATADCKASCYSAQTTFPGMVHSGDNNQGEDLLQYISIQEALETGKEFCIFVSGFQEVSLTRFQERNPVVMIANHAEKALYIVSVPLDTASIGSATICTPLVFKREGDSLICCILPTPATDLGMSCTGGSLQTPSFKEAIDRADWTIPTSTIAPEALPVIEAPIAAPSDSVASEQLTSIPVQENAVFITQKTALTSLSEKTQIIRYGTGLEFLSGIDEPVGTPSEVVLPCIFGSRLEGPLLLATGKTPENVPFRDEQSLHSCYSHFKSVVVYVDENMTDNARNLATRWRMNAVFVVQVTQEASPGGDVKALLNLVNINAVTALAGPQSLVLVQISDKYYFYRGIANRAYLNTSKITFGSDVTEIVQRAGLSTLLDPRVDRLVNLHEASNTVLLPESGRKARSADLKDLFGKIELNELKKSEEDISAIIPQLQVLMSQANLLDLSRSLINVLSEKVGNELEPIRTQYINFITMEYKMNDPESVKKKNSMLGDVRKASREVQKTLESIISQLSNMMSSQTTSKRTHDLQRLERQAAIQNNVEAVKSMTFETLGALLETKAGDMGVLLLNIETEPFEKLLGDLKRDHLDASACCDLDSRVLFLEGFDAGIIIEQSQHAHHGPLKHQLGVNQPNLALPYLSQERGTGSMLAWVCWDEFVNLENPFGVRWMERCNESHIAAFRILMRDTLSRSVVSREYNMQPANPETGQLMSALLMSAMSKLAAMRTTAPTRTITAEDTITKLMRGLFGNLLTTAGSGVRPMSMVWQLLGMDPKFDVPKTAVDWSWYETVVRLYPYSGWPQKQFNLNLERLLDKALLAVITKNEIAENLKASRAELMIKYCKLRNIQLEHSRTIVNIFIRMMESGADRKTIATRLLAALPSHLDKYSKSYPKMIQYLEYVASTGLRREWDDNVVAGVYLKRSATFKTLKLAIADACKSGETIEVKKLCLELMGKFNEIADSWGLAREKLVMQNAKAYKALLDSLSSDADAEDEAIKKQRKKLTGQVVGDAERLRVPWQVGKPGEFGDDIEPLDDAFLDEIMTGEKALPPTTAVVKPVGSEVEKVVKPQGMQQFASVVVPGFITSVDNALTSKDVCAIMNIPASAMAVFASTLNPAFDVEKDLGANFRRVVFDLLADRSERIKQQPIRALFGMEKSQVALEDGAGDRQESGSQDGTGIEEGEAATELPILVNHS